MDLGSIVGQLMQGGLSSATPQRVQHAAGDQGLGGLGGGLDDILGGLLGGGSGGSQQSSGGLGGILGSVGGMLSGDSGVGGLSRGQVGGIGAIAGALLGGGGGAISGGGQRRRDGSTWNACNLSAPQLAKPKLGRIFRSVTLRDGSFTDKRTGDGRTLLPGDDRGCQIRWTNHRS